jgi:hypothetical protein
MQNSELYRRGIVLPLDQGAEECLRTGDVTESTPVRCLTIDEAFFMDLCAWGLFRRISHHIDVLIDDYEEEFVEAELLDEVQAAIQETRAQRNAGDIEPFLDDLSALVTEAQSLGRPILFVL